MQVRCDVLAKTQFRLASLIHPVDIHFPQTQHKFLFILSRESLREQSDSHRKMEVHTMKCFNVGVLLPGNDRPVCLTSIDYKVCHEGGHNGPFTPDCRLIRRAAWLFTKKFLSYNPFSHRAMHNESDGCARISERSVPRLCRSPCTLR